MNPDAIAVFIPISAFVMGGLVMITKYLTQGRRQGSSETVDARLESLEHELTSVRNELAETQERLDFADVCSRSHGRTSIWTRRNDTDQVH